LQPGITPIHVHTELLIRVGRVVAGVALTAALSACDAADPGATASPSTIGITVPPVTSSVAPPSTGGSPSQVPSTTAAEPGSPIDQIIPFLQLTDQQRRLVGLEYGRRLEAHVAICMAREGFRYVPIDPDQPGLTGTPEGLPATAEEMAEEYGYGVVLNVRLSYQPITTEIDDPNVAIQEALSPAEQEAYWQSYGVCVTEAVETYPDPFGSDSEEEAWLADQLFAIQTAVWEDPRVQQAVDGWSRCMAEQGYEFAHPDDARAHIADLVAPISNAQTGLGLDDAAAAELDRLQETELEVARTDFACAEQLDRTIEGVRSELEAELIEENGERIAAYAATYESSIADYLHLLDE